MVLIQWRTHSESVQRTLLDIDSLNFLIAKLLTRTPTNMANNSSHGNVMSLQFFCFCLFPEITGVRCIIENTKLTWISYWPIICKYTTAPYDFIEASNVVFLLLLDVSKFQLFYSIPDTMILVNIHPLLNRIFTDSEEKLYHDNR